jgi:hypothetical protein
MGLGLSISLYRQLRYFSVACLNLYSILLETILIFSVCAAATTRVEICYAPEDQKDQLIRSIREDYVRGTCASTDVTLRTPLQGGPLRRTHRLLLAAVSPLLSHLLTTAEEEEPMIVFDETVTEFELEQLLVLLYSGEVRVDAADRDRLSGFKAFLAQLGIDKDQLSESSVRQPSLPVRQGRKASSSVRQSPVSQPPMRQPSLPLTSARPVYQTHSLSSSVPLTQIPARVWESAGHGPLPGPPACRPVAAPACPDSQRKRRMTIIRVLCTKKNRIAIIGIFMTLYL